MRHNESESAYQAVLKYLRRQYPGSVTVQQTSAVTGVQRDSAQRILEDAGRRTGKAGREILYALRMPGDITG